MWGGVGGVVGMQTRMYFLFLTCLLEVFPPFSLSPDPPELLELLSKIRDLSRRRIEAARSLQINDVQSFFNVVSKKVAL